MTSALTPVPEPDEAPARRQVGVLAEVFVEGEDRYELRITNRERLHYEKTAAKHKEWPSAETGRFFHMTFVLWSAAKRAEKTALTFEQWQDALEDWNVLDEEAADPTR
jgi:hypothetical protein